jgi:flagellar secretion chaperone FliS
MYGRVSNNYNRVAVETANQKTLIMTCYDEAIRALRKGKECYLTKKFEEKNRQFNRAQDFITELSSSLNLEAGGEIALQLRNIYRFVLANILEADLRRNMKLVDELVALLSELRSAWAEIDIRPATGIVYSQNQAVPETVRGIAV